MFGMRAALCFRLALLLVLVSCCISSYVIARAQTGTRWEVPVAIVELIRTWPLVALILAASGLLLYLCSWLAGRVSGTAQGSFFAVLVMAFSLPFIIWYLHPEQWPYRFPLLSLFAVLQLAPMIVNAVICFWVIGFRWVRTSGT